MTSREVTIRVTRDGASLFSASFLHTPITIGTSPENDLELDDESVGREHAIVTLSGGRLTYQDRSSSGSFVAGERIVERALAPNDVVSIPPFELHFSLAANALDASLPVAVLEVIAGPAALTGRQFHLASDHYEIGRAESAGIRLDVQTVSRAHASLSRSPEGDWLLEDLASGNGTFVNERRVRKVALSAGDRILLGKDTRLLFLPAAAPRLPSQASEPPTDFHLVERRVGGGRLVLELEGQIDAGNYLAFRQRLDRTAADEIVILDLSRLKSLDYRGLGVLVHYATALDEVDSELRLVGLKEGLRKIFALSGLDLFFEGKFEPDRDTALGSSLRQEE